MNLIKFTDSLPEEVIKIEEYSNNTQELDSASDPQSFITSDQLEDAVIDILGSYGISEERETEDINQVPLLTSASSLAISIPDSNIIYEVRFQSVTYKVLFPKNTAEYLQSADGYLINTSSSNITGVVVSANGFDLSNYHSTITLMPLASGSTQSNVYRYGSHSYFTSYSPSGTGYQTLTGTNTYGNFEIVSGPKLGSSFSFFNLALLGLVSILVIFQLIGGLIHK